MMIVRAAASKELISKGPPIGSSTGDGGLLQTNADRILKTPTLWSTSPTTNYSSPNKTCRMSPSQTREN